MKLNKAGWHFPQSRILDLGGCSAHAGWNQTTGTVLLPGQFQRLHQLLSHSNLVLGVRADDFQIRTLTEPISANTSTS